LAVSLAACGQDVTIPGTGTVYGTLYHAAGCPAVGVTVLVENTGLSTISDGDGKFVVNEVLAVDEISMGKYYVVRGYGEFDGESIGFLVDHFKVKGAQAYSVGEVMVPPTGTLVGTIWLAGTGDHSGVTIRLGGTSLSTLTRADGSYRLDGVPAHSGYEVICLKPGFEEAILTTMPGEGSDPIGVEPREVVHLEGTTLNRL
jgi:hypothetical protein